MAYVPLIPLRNQTVNYIIGGGVQKASIGPVTSDGSTAVDMSGWDTLSLKIETRAASNPSTISTLTDVVTGDNEGNLALEVGDFALDAQSTGSLVGVLTGKKATGDAPQLVATLTINVAQS